MDEQIKTYKQLILNYIKKNRVGMIVTAAVSSALLMVDIILYIAVYTDVYYINYVMLAIASILILTVPIMFFSMFFCFKRRKKWGRIELSQIIDCEESVDYSKEVTATNITAVVHKSRNANFVNLAATHGIKTSGIYTTFLVTYQDGTKETKTVENQTDAYNFYIKYLESGATIPQNN